MNALAVSGAFVPDYHIRPDDYTVLMAADATRPPELKPFQAGAHGKFHVAGWSQPEQALEWEFTVPEEDAYSVNVLLLRQESQVLRLEVTGAAQALSGWVPASQRGWTRQTLDGLLRLPAGKQRLVLRARSSNDTSPLFNNWTAMISEAGQRYGDRLAGWWFDDGAISYYYRSAPWVRLASAAKAGHSMRLIAFNPWELPTPTEFQDYFCGEGNTDPSVGGSVAIGGNGRISSGPHQGLQACATLITEQDWVHARKDTDIGPPKWDASQLAALLKEFISRKNVPIFNLEVYQEGTLSPKSVELFKHAASHLSPRH